MNTVPNRRPTRFKETLGNPENIGRASNIRWNGTLWNLSRNTERHGLLASEMTGEIGSALAAQAHTDMRYQAKWKDQSGTARSALYADFDSQGHTYKMDLGYRQSIMSGSPSYRMPYDLLLEHGHGGRYAIVGPTSTRVAYQWMAECRRFMGAGRR